MFVNKMHSLRLDFLPSATHCRAVSPASQNQYKPQLPYKVTANCTSSLILFVGDACSARPQSPIQWFASVAASPRMGPYGPYPSASPAHAVGCRRWREAIGSEELDRGGAMGFDWAEGGGGRDAGAEARNEDAVWPVVDADVASSRSRRRRGDAENGWWGGGGSGGWS